MLCFFIGMAILVAGYFTYGRLVEKILSPDDRKTPALENPDGVDFLVMPKWKNMLIQLLNIAGVGPVIGVILGIKFGAIVFLFIPIGNLIGGAVHDFVAGMMSIRSNGANLPEIVRQNLGSKTYAVFSAFMCLVLFLVVAVFINIPASLVNGLFEDADVFWYAAAAIFIYYVAATLFPVDKIIGRFYPIFGALLVVGTIVIFGKLCLELCSEPDLLSESTAFELGKIKQPILPMLFVTIACGILSGFHATQSPIVARTMKSEREAKATFYGMMVLEGLIAMVWAAAGMAIYNLKPLLMADNPNNVLIKITDHFLGSNLGTVTVLSVIVLAITSGDTAMRSLRLSVAEIFHISQKEVRNRILLCLPMVVIVLLLLWWSNQDAKSFGMLWNYFAWGNQVLAAVTLTAATGYLVREKKNFVITAVPGVFMSFIVLTFILWTSKAHGGPVGLGLDLAVAQTIALVLAIFFNVYTLYRTLKSVAAKEEK